MPPVAEAEELKPAGPHGGGPGGFDPGDGGGGGDGGGSDDYPQYLSGAGVFAMRFALVSVTVLFLTIGIAYFYRAQSAVNWQHIGVPRALWLSTALILASSWTLERARSSLERRNQQRYLRGIQMTAAIGVAFLACQLVALEELVSQGIYLRHNPHSSLFYVVTGAHGLHLLGGMGALCYLLLWNPGFLRLRVRTTVTALYWHFLTVLWVGLFVCLLLWP